MSRRDSAAAGGLGPSGSLWPKALAAAVPPPSELLLQRGHADRVTALAFSADGATMVSASDDSTLRVWRTADRVLLRVLPSHLVGVTALSLSPDATMLASGDGTGSVILWRLSDLVPLRHLGPPPHDRGIARLEFLQDGSGFAALDLGGKAVLWTLAGEGLKTIPLSDSATAIAAGEDVVVLAGPAQENAKTIRVVSRDGKPLRSFDGPGGLVTVNALAVRGDRVAAGNRTGGVGVWAMKDGERLQAFGVGAPVDFIAFSEHAILAGAGRDVWCVWKSQALPPTSVALPGPIARIAVSADGLAPRPARPREESSPGPWANRGA